MSPAICWVMFVRIKVTTMATDLYRPITGGLPPGLTTFPAAAATRAASSVSCPRRSPVIASSRNGFSLGYPACVTARIQGRSRSHCQPDTTVAVLR